MGDVMIGYSKQQQLYKKRIKPTQKQLGDISPKVRSEVRLRSGGRCERCGGKAAQMAHTVRRWKLKEKTTADHLLHLCVNCHIWADTTREGREYLAKIASKRTG